ncbi:MAG: hypothetical protein K0S33_1568 [Bacteroidetes bacterium]|jgi:uncharacterized repeat protein (TIGR01451 family)|nr:hypothetical protein [Bacteroidota bacterium]
MKPTKLRVLVFICILAVFANIQTNAQQLVWAKSIGGTATETGADIAVDNSGNVYTTGYFWSTADFDPGPGIYNMTNEGSFDIFISKLDYNGNFVWAKQISGAADEDAKSVKVDLQGNVYITGHFEGTVDFDPGPAIQDITTSNNFDTYVLKLNSAGDLVWVKTFLGFGNDYGTSLEVDDQGNVYHFGYTDNMIDLDPGTGSSMVSSNGGYDAILTKLDINGDFIWGKIFGSTFNDYGRHISLDDAGDIYLTGYFQGTVDFDPDAGVANLSSNGLLDVFVSKFSSAGSFLWAKNFGGAGQDYGQSIGVDKNGFVYTTGSFSGSVDFDPSAGMASGTSNGSGDIFIHKLDALGNFVWVKTLGDVDADFGTSLGIDSLGNVFIAGAYENYVDFDPGAGNANLFSQPAVSEGFILVLSEVGNFINCKRMGGSNNDAVAALELDEAGTIYCTGYFYEQSDFESEQDSVYLTSGGDADVFIAKYKMQRIAGHVFNDLSFNCWKENNEPGLNGRKAIIQPGNIIVETGTSGFWYVDSLPAGNYSITYDTTGYWEPTCPVTAYFVVVNPTGFTMVQGFGLKSTRPCAAPDISVTAPFLRRCFTDQKIYVNARNLSTAADVLIGAYVELQLDSFLVPGIASLSYTTIGDNRYRFNLGNMAPGQFASFWMAATVSCDAILDQTLCLQAELFPADSCVFDTIPAVPMPGVTPCLTPWNRSSISVNGWCQNDSVYFTITNTGPAGISNMTCFSPVRLFIDGQFASLDSVQLMGGETDTLVFWGNGQTWRLEVDQHPLHPGNSHPNVTVELCGNIANWTPDLINILPLNDADPVVDIYCGLVSGAYDPNDKTGFPTGIGSIHEILPNQQLQYLIRFQNTGSDTAFTIIIRDTLDTDLNIFSVVPGASSHNYIFRMYGPRVLEWTFNHIMLPDSTTDEPGSHGFITFRVDQHPDLPNGTVILNDADIYFDFNVPVITNQTHHTISHGLNTLPVGISHASKLNPSGINVYPNPTTGTISIDLQESTPKTEIIVFNLLGKEVQKTELRNAAKAELNIDGESGIYFIKITSGTKTAIVKVVKL